MLLYYCYLTIGVAGILIKVFANQTPTITTTQSMMNPTATQSNFLDFTGGFWTTACWVCGREEVSVWLLLIHSVYMF